MWTALYWSVIFHSIEWSSQSKKLPGNAPLPDVYILDSPSPESSSGQESSQRNLHLARFHSPGQSSLSVGPPLRARSRSPPRSSPASSASNRPSSSTSSSLILGFTLEEIKHLRLIPCNNISRILELRRYTFPRGTPIRLQDNKHAFTPLPNALQIVLSTSNGEVFAMYVKYANARIFRGIFIRVDGKWKRAKINMNSGVYGVMSPEEIAEVPTGMQNPIEKRFTVIYVPHWTQ